jgi:DNA repair exonuclease SbcCD ATPase subunit
MWKDELSKIQSDIQHLETAPRYEDNSDYIKTLKKQVSEYKETQRCRQYFTQLQDAENELAKAEKRHTAAQKLKVIISQAQTEVVRSTIRRIGELANAYATQIFNDPITIRMNVDGNENGKSSINLEILLKGIECTFGMLSGGEQARMNLAFVLALFNTFHGEILLLDEITSQLNQELAEHVVDIIQKVTQGKVILVAHQLVEGNFDQVISL